MTHKSFIVSAVLDPADSVHRQGRCAFRRADRQRTEENELVPSTADQADSLQGYGKQCNRQETCIDFVIAVHGGYNLLLVVQRSAILYDVNSIASFISCLPTAANFFLLPALLSTPFAVTFFGKWLFMLLLLLLLLC